MSTLVRLALSALLFAAAPQLASASCSDEKGFCPFRDGAAAGAAEGEKNCGAMAMAAGDQRGCCGAEAEATDGCCGGAHADDGGCCGAGESCSKPKGEGGAAPHTHPGA